MSDFLSYLKDNFPESYSVIKLCPILCDPMDCSKPAFPVLHYLPDLAQILF